MLISAYNHSKATPAETTLFRPPGCLQHQFFLSFHQFLEGTSSSCSAWYQISSTPRLSSLCSTLCSKSMFSQMVLKRYRHRGSSKTAPKSTRENAALTKLYLPSDIVNLLLSPCCWRPSLSQVSVSEDSYALSKCFLPEESTVINVYCLAGACTMLLFLAHCLWMKGLLQCLSLVVLGKHKSLWTTHNAPQPRTEPLREGVWICKCQQDMFKIYTYTHTHVHIYCLYIGLCVFKYMCTCLVDYFIVVTMLLFPKAVYFPKNGAKSSPPKPNVFLCHKHP